MKSSNPYAPANRYLPQNPRYAAFERIRTLHVADEVSDAQLEAIIEEIIDDTVFEKLTGRRR